MFLIQFRFIEHPRRFKNCVGRLKLGWKSIYSRRKKENHAEDRDSSPDSYAFPKNCALIINNSVENIFAK